MQSRSTGADCKERLKLNCFLFIVPFFAIFYVPKYLIILFQDKVKRKAVEEEDSDSTDDDEILNNLCLLGSRWVVAKICYIFQILLY